MSRYMKPIPFSDTILCEPDKVPGLIRDFHKQRSLDRKVFLQSILDVYGKNGSEMRAPWEALVKAGIVDALMSVIMDTEELKRAQFDDYTRGYLTLTMLVLRRTGIHLCGIALAEKQNRQVRAQARAMIDKTGPLWTLLWSMKLPVFDATNYEKNHFPTAVAGFIDVMVDIHEALDGKAPSSTVYPMMHVALYIWIYGATDAEITRHLLLPLVKLVDGSRHALRTVFQEAVTDARLTDNLVEQLCCQLRIAELVDEPLHYVSSLLSAVVIYCPGALDARLRYSPHSLLHCIRLACQRQMCLGRSEVDTVAVWTPCFGAVQHIIKEHMTGESASLETRRATLSELVKNLNFIPMLARGAIYAVRQQDSYLLNTMQLIGMIYVGRTDVNRDTSPGAAEVLRVTRNVWLPTLKELRALPAPRDKKARALYDRAEEFWRTMGVDMGLNEDTEERRWREAGPKPMKPAWPAWRGCRWRDCLCCGDSHAPHRMRVCKGCRSVHYCSTACQTRDWNEGGHKEDCVRLR